MPRVTKKQKEAGIQPKHKSKSTAGNPPKKGFQVGPSRAGKDAYLGKAQKIKAELILNAKAKKQFAKYLKSEGLDSARLGDGSKRRGERGSGVTKSEEGVGGQVGNGKQRGHDEQADDDKGEDKEGDDDDALSDVSSDLDVERYGSRSRSRKDNDHRTAPSSSASTSNSHSRPTHRIANPKSSLHGKSPTSKTSNPTPTPTPKIRALSPERQPAANLSSVSASGLTAAGEQTKTEPPRSMREMKKEAYSKYHRPKVPFGSGSGSGSGSATYGKSRGAYPGAGSSASRSGGLGGRKRGQPNIGARMGVLLEQIRREKGTTNA